MRKGGAVKPRPFQVVALAMVRKPSVDFGGYLAEAFTRKLSHKSGQIAECTSFLNLVSLCLKAFVAKYVCLASGPHAPACFIFSAIDLVDSPANKIEAKRE